MRVYELAKTMSMKAADLLNILKQTDFKYNSINNSLKDDPEDIKEAVLKFQDTQREDKAKIEEYAKGVFLGMSFDPTTKKFKRILLRIDMSKLIDVECDIQELGEHGSIYGAKLELYKDMQKNLMTNPKEFE